MSRDAKDKRSLDLFAEETPVDAEAHRLDWPDSARFPLNVDRRHVRDRVLEDLLASHEPLLVTGYAALDHLIDFIAETPEGGHLRLLLGFEPFLSRRDTLQQRRVVRQTAFDCFGPEASATVFGSRADDTARGGDIELLIETHIADLEEIVNAEMRFQGQIQRAIGEQKIDLRVDYPGRGEHPPIFAIAEGTGVRL